MGRSILAIVLGVVLAFALVPALEALGHLIYPPPTDLDFSDTEALGHYISQAPVMALLLVILAWSVATGAGSCLAAWLAPRSPFAHASVVGGLVLIASIFNMLMIPHPVWFWIVALLAIPGALTLGVLLCRRRSNP